MSKSPIASGPDPHSAGKRPGTKTGQAELLLEIGTEELPSQFLPPALRALGDSAERLLKEHRLPHGAVRTFGSPRRMVLAVESVSGRQAATVKEVMGPSKAAAYDAAGQPTSEAIGFAGSQGVTVGGLEIRRTPKGEYVFAVRREAGGSAVAVLGEILPLERNRHAVRAPDPVAADAVRRESGQHPDRRDQGKQSDVWAPLSRVSRVRPLARIAGERPQNVHEDVGASRRHS